MLLNRPIYVLFLLISGSFSLIAQSLDDLDFGTAATFDILTWNIEQFPKNGGTTITYVTEIIEAMDADLLAIQEVNDVSSFNQLTAGLSNYDGYLESVFFGGLAYIYKPSVIQVNSTYEIYTTSEYWNYFPRAPMVMDLDFMNQKFIIINNHFKCCGDGFLDLSDENDEETRRYFASNLLIEYIDANFPNDNVIVLGDLNDDLADAPQNNVFQNILNDQAHFLFADLDIANGSNTEWSFPNWPSHLDHILLTNELFGELANMNSSVQTLKIDEFLTGGWPEYDMNVSDHRPVGLKLWPDENLAITDFDEAKSTFQNYPNPFSSKTTFAFDAGLDIDRIDIYHVSGQKLMSLDLHVSHESVLWNAEHYPSGIYIARLISRNQPIATRKLVLMR